MLTKLRKFPLHFIFPIILISFASILAIANYVPNTWLSGWDTLHPEFNLSLSFQKIIFGVWRPEQGLGAIAAHSHMSELPRYIFLLLVKSFLPVAFLRYFYFFVCLGIGPIGTYFFIKKATSKNNFALISSFLGAVYYLFNLATIQHFYVPFEMFATQYAFLPWIFYLCLKVFNDEKIKLNLIIFTLISFLASPQAYAATLYYALLGGFTIFLISYSLLHKKRLIYFKKSIILIFLFLSANFYWLLPNLYSIFNQSEVVSSSKINQLFTDEAFLRNQEYGSYSDVIIHKSFLFSWREYDDKRGTFVDLMDEWKVHLENGKAKYIAYIAAIFVLLGILFVFLKKDKVGIALLPVFVFAVFFLMNENPPLGFLYTFLRNNISLIEEGFRMPFTKFSILFLFTCSYYFSFLIFIIFCFFRKWISVLISIIFLLSITASLLYLFLPAFKGNLISPSMKVKIPSEYFELFDWFNNSSQKGRIAKLPLNSFWGWEYNDWGYEGSGFLSFGIKNPILLRDFDRWNPENETFYSQASNALYSGDKVSFLSILKKYQVKYLLIDESIINAGGSDNALYLPQIKEFLSDENLFQKKVQFGFLSVFEVYGVTSEELSSPTTISYDNSKSTYDTVDTTFFREGDYVSAQKASFSPFINFDSRANFTTTIDTQNIVLKNKISREKSTLKIPDLIKNEDFIPIDIFISKIGTQFQVKFVSLTPKIFIDNRSVFDEPIEYRYLIPVKNDLGFLNINDKTFDVTGKNIENEIYVGTTNVSTKDLTQIRFYSSQENTNDAFPQQIIRNQATFCNDPNQKVSFSPGRGGFSLSATNNSVCLGNNISFADDSLVKLSFESDIVSYPYFCITQVGFEGCRNQIAPTNFKLLGNTRENSYFTSLESDNYWFAFVAQANKNGNAVNFDNLKLSTFALLDKTDISFGDSFSVFSKNHTLEVNDKSELEIKIPYRVTANEDFAFRRGHLNAVNCDIYKLGSVSKNYTDESVVYSAKDGGVSCDYFDYPNLSYSQGYLLRIKGQNLLGRSLKFYLQNIKTGRMDQEHILSENKFDEAYFIRPNSRLSDGGYILNLETRSFGKITSKNVLEDIEFIPIPINWLQGISVNPNLLEEISHSNDLNIHINWELPFLISIDAHVKGEKGIVVLNQSFDKGWVSLQRLPHLVFNNWANAWEVPEGDNNVIIIFLPQSLEIVGFLSLLLSFPLIYLASKSN